MEDDNNTASKLMNNEIKEKIKAYYMGNDIDKVLDYITNLQEENKKLKEELQQEKRDFKEANDYCFELQDYKSRNEKAIEKLKSIRIFGLRSGKTLFSTLINETIDILEKGRVIKK